jgi:cytochrome c556
MKKTAVAVLFVAAAAVPVVAQEMKPENQIKYRRAAYQLMNLNFVSLENMAKDKKPFNPAQAQRNADLVAILSSIPKEYFGEGTDKDTKAKPEIWTQRADFDAKMDKLVTEAGKLPVAVRAGDGAAFKKQVADVGAACKACHDDYRAKAN